MISDGLVQLKVRINKAAQIHEGSYERTGLDVKLLYQGAGPVREKQIAVSADRHGNRFVETRGIPEKCAAGGWHLRQVHLPNPFLKYLGII